MTNIEINNYSLEQKKLVFRILKRFHFTLNRFPLFDFGKSWKFYAYGKPLEKTIFSALCCIIGGGTFKVYTECHERIMPLCDFLATVNTISDYKKLCEKIDFSEVCKIYAPSSQTFSYLYNRWDSIFLNRATSSYNTTTSNNTIFQPLYTSL